MLLAGAGFISIDCGASQESRSGNISWTIDSSYTLLGTTANTQVGAVAPYDTLRYFPDKKFNKSCYVFNTTVSMSYLIRAGFLYGNYDNKHTLPRFVLLFGADMWTDVIFTDTNQSVTHEMIALATSNTTSVCVGRTNNDDPFISSLEVRPLSTNPNMYSPVHENFLMKSNSRQNFGQTNNDTVRYVPTHTLLIEANVFLKSSCMYSRCSCKIFKKAQRGRSTANAPSFATTMRVCVHQP